MLVLVQQEQVKWKDEMNRKSELNEFPNLNLWFLFLGKRVRSYLDGTKCIEQVRVVANAGADASTFMLTGFDEVNDLVAVHTGQMTHQVHHCQTPVDAAHPQVLRQCVLLHLRTKI